MTLKLEEYNPERHDKPTVAASIFQSDEELNSLVYGPKEQGIRVIEKILGQPHSYYSPMYLKCVIYKGEIAGVIAGFPVNKKSELDNNSGRAFIRAMGFLSFLKRMPLFLRMAKITGGEMDKEGYYIHTISVSPACRGQGLGRLMIEMVAKKYRKVYLHVNIHNEGAQKFYKKVGFKPQLKAVVTIKGREYGTYFMARADD